MWSGYLHSSIKQTELRYFMTPELEHSRVHAAKYYKKFNWFKRLLLSDIKNKLYGEVNIYLSIIHHTLENWLNPTWHAGTGGYRDGRVSFIERQTTYNLKYRHYNSIKINTRRLPCNAFLWQRNDLPQNSLLTLFQLDKRLLATRLHYQESITALSPPNRIRHHRVSVHKTSTTVDKHAQS